MTTASGHTSAILASKVQGTNIYNQAGDKIGQVKDMGSAAVGVTLVMVGAFWLFAIAERMGAI